jgi:hypothetical protein
MSEKTWQEASDEERRIILDARRDPAGTKLPDGKSVLEHRAELQKEERARGKEQDARDLKAMRASSSAAPPEKVAVTLNGAGALESRVLEEATPPGELPADFPHRDLLVSGGITTRAQLAAADDETLLGIENIAEGRLKEIRKAEKKLK